VKLCFVASCLVAVGCGLKEQSDALLFCRNVAELVDDREPALPIA
jgi:hypothetical protein